MSHPVILTRHGYYELADKPSAQQLAEYYAKKYYQESIRVHRPTYEAEEIRFRHAKLEQKRLKVEELRRDAAAGRLLDVGAGEAFAMKHFADAGWEVIGLDYSRHGCETHHPELLDKLIVGDVMTGLEQLEKTAECYDLILLDNVLEHVIDPLAVLCRLRKLLSLTGILVVEVPNDFSRLQMQLLEDGTIPEPFWVVAPDHLSYFNAEGLTALANEAGLERRALLADFPIDFFLVNDHSNYAVDRSIGKAAHKARVALDLMIHEVSPTGANAFYEALGSLGFGRQIIAFLSVLADTEGDS